MDFHGNVYSFDGLCTLMHIYIYFESYCKRKLKNKSFTNN
jgi:uncharacterized membrane protein YuzA (DUF378 family)